MKKFKPGDIVVVKGRPYDDQIRHQRMLNDAIQGLPMRVLRSFYAKGRGGNLICVSDLHGEIHQDWFKLATKKQIKNFGMAI